MTASTVSTERESAEAAAGSATDVEWDRFVSAARNGAYPQNAAWAEVKAATGWSAERIMLETPSPVGAQLLFHRLGPSPWSVAYAPRGPVAPAFDADNVRAFSERARELGRKRRASHLTVDPEVEAGDPLADHLRAAGWVPGRSIQNDRTRIVDLTQSEEQLWSDLRKKWRQYVQRARRGGIVVVESGPEGLDEFFAILVETARRGGFVHRAKGSYVRVFEAYRRRGAARLLFARGPGGEAHATLMLIASGGKVIEPYGGMTAAGAESRANYLIKWEAIRRSRESGFAIYDMWGLSHAGIEHFKSGFGGREVRYIGAWDLVLNPLVRRGMHAAQRLRVTLARRRHGLDGRTADA
jgi:lipid II:glycine glycyltransferase (peptidoglycan interpeptide bridge formation enzyme)